VDSGWHTPARLGHAGVDDSEKADWKGIGLLVVNQLALISVTKKAPVNRRMPFLPNP